MILTEPSMLPPERAMPQQILGSDPGESSPRATKVHGDAQYTIDIQSHEAPPNCKQGFPTIGLAR